MHRDELLGVVKEKGQPYFYDVCDEVPDKKILHDGINPEILLFALTGNDKLNVVNLYPIFAYKKRQQKAITTAKDIRKYATDVLGNLYEVKDSSYA